MVEKQMERLEAREVVHFLLLILATQITIVGVSCSRVIAHSANQTLLDARNTTGMRWLTVTKPPAQRSFTSRQVHVLESSLSQLPRG